MSHGKRDLLLDANVLIDYAQNGRSVLRLMAAHFAAVRVPSPVAKEVRGDISAAQVTRLGLALVDPEWDEVMDASVRGGPLSFQDKICLEMARRRAWVLVTNDRTLRKRCIAEGAAIEWGLNPMLHLVQAGHMAREDALAVAEAIVRRNARMTDAVLTAFRQKLEP